MSCKCRILNRYWACNCQYHQRSHGISYDEARKDLLAMAETLGLLQKTRAGKRFLFIVPDDLERRIQKRSLGAAH